MYLNRKNPYSPGYALPQNVLDEPLGRGVITTRYTPRRTIATYSPPTFRAARVATGLGSLGGTPNGSLGGKSKSMFGVLGGLGSLGGTTVPSHAGVKVGGPGDPIATFGKKSARVILANVGKVPVSHRTATLHTILDAIDPALWETVFGHTSRLAKGGTHPKKALEKALSIEMANHFTGQLVRLGKTGVAPSRGAIALGCACAAGVKPPGLSGWFDSVTDAVGGAAKFVGSHIADAAVTTGKFVGNQAANAASAAYHAAGSALSNIGGLACSAANSGILGAVAGAGGAVFGGPAGGAAGSKGADFAKSLCSSGQAPVNLNAVNQAIARSGGGGGVAYGPPSSGFPIVPIAIGVVGVGALIYLATRK
jgi:hypothetical protein